MNVPNVHSLALHEFAGVYRGVYSIEKDVKARVGEIAVAVNSKGVSIARATLEGPQNDTYPAGEVQKVDPSEVERQLTKDFQNFKAFRLGEHIMAISHRTDDKPSLIMLGGSGFTSLFGPNQMQIFDQKIDTIVRQLGAIPRLSK